MLIVLPMVTLCMVFTRALQCSSSKYLYDKLDDRPLDCILLFVSNLPYTVGLF